MTDHPLIQPLVDQIDILAKRIAHIEKALVTLSEGKWKPFDPNDPPKSETTS